jgi:hypothetical protein
MYLPACLPMQRPLQFAHRLVGLTSRSWLEVREFLMQYSLLLFRSA